MFESILFLGICSAFALGSKLPVPDKKIEKIVNCYYDIGRELSSNDPKGSLHIDYIDVSLCTHITYGDTLFKDDASLYCGKLDVNGKNSEIIRFNDLRKKKPHLKTLVTLSASQDYDLNSTKVATNPILRQKVVNNIVEFVRKYELNGFDINWQFPVPNSADQLKVHSEKQNFVLLLKALREKFNKEGLILSVTVGATEEVARISYDIKEISKYVDFINLQTYNLWLSNDAAEKVTHNTPMYPASKENAEDRKLNIDYVVNYWISQGAPPRKLILGTDFRETAYTLANTKKVGRGAPTVGIGLIDLFGGYPGYYQICPFLKNPEWRYLYDKEQQVPYIYKGNLILAIDDVESIKKKAEYVKKMNLGGVFVWSIDQDDFSGHCGEKYPLLKTLNRVLGNKC